ncbi:30S ribosomal protein S2 [Candidatus Vidania fulgoroideorum]
MKNYFNILINNSKANLGHKIKENIRFYNNKIEYKKLDSFYINKKITKLNLKKLFSFLRIFLKKKRTILFVDTKKNHSHIYESMSINYDIYYTKKWKPGYITNFRKNKIGEKKKLLKIPDIVFIIDTSKNKVALNECIKKKIFNVSITDSNYVKKTNFFIPINDDSETSIIFFLNQLFYILKKVDVYKRINKNNIFIFEKKFKKYILLLKLKKYSDYYINKKYFKHCIDKILINYYNKKIKDLKNIINKLSNYYNEKFYIIGFKKLLIKKTYYYNHNNNYVILIKFNKNKSSNLLYHIVFNIKNLFCRNFFLNTINYNYSNIVNYIKKKKIKINKIFLI